MPRIMRNFGHGRSHMKTEESSANEPSKDELFKKINGCITNKWNEETINDCFTLIKDNRMTLVELATSPSEDNSAVILRGSLATIRTRVRKKGLIEKFLKTKESKICTLVDHILHLAHCHLLFQDSEFVAQNFFKKLTSPNDDFTRHLPSGLRNLEMVSKQWHAAVQRLKLEWVQEQNASLKFFNLKSTSEAIDFAVHNRLTSLNLIEFQDLNDEHLKVLGENLPQLKNLIIKSNHITTLPETFQNLEILHAHDCSELIALPSSMKLARIINVKGCLKLPILPDRLDSLKYLIISRCNQLELKDNLLIKELYCLEIENDQFKYPRGMKNLKILDDRGCNPRPELPEDLPNDCYVVPDSEDLSGS